MTATVHDICIIGAGFGGLCAGIHLGSDGADVVILEAAERLGGTWRDNTYPGVACDVQSHLYSFSFAANPDWSRTFAPGDEIQAYLENVAARFQLSSVIRFGVRVEGARWSAEDACWVVQTSEGELRARMLVPAVGGLSRPKLPNLPGVGDFEGPAFHTQGWRHDLDFAGKRVGVIGTGASAIQVVPELAKTAAEVRVFQRTAPWVMAKPDRPVGKLERWAYRRIPGALKLRRWGVYWRLESRVVAFVLAPKLLSVIEWQARRELKRAVPDPELRRVVTPDFTLGCKRVLLSNNYYPALQEPNVVVDTAPIVSIEPAGVQTDTLHELDVLIYATGFAATEGPSLEVVGTHGSLAEAWADGMSAYLGTTVSGFPNLFLITGPNSGLGHSSMVFIIESQVAYLREAWALLASGARSVDVKAEVQEAFNVGLQSRLGGTVWASGCKAWYVDAKGRNTTLWPDFTWRFAQRTRHFDVDSYTVG
ncbi:MAG: NAD(P)/FAD-dependent oxidoreductase [Proteobacteria bacterium]|nr:NAD(P)/FAD-dependent oxidoreductase [Pseudomonadota bacterium]